MMEAKIYGPFLPYNRRGLPIVLKNGIPAWMVTEPRRARPPVDRYDFYTPMPQPSWVARLFGKVL